MGAASLASALIVTEKMGAAAAGGVGVGEKRVVFVSYSRDDAEWRRRFVEMLEPSVRRRGFEVWSDMRIEPGERWYPELEAAIARTEV